MAQTYKTEGIILKRWNFKEKDKLVRILTPDYGKITTRAISARKITSKLAGHLEPFIYADFFIAQSKTIDIVAGSNTIHSHRTLRHSLSHSALANYLCEIVDRTTEEEQEDPELFTHIHSMLRWLNENDANMLVVQAGILQLFAILGYRLGLYECHSCKESIQPEGSAFHYGLLHVECANCSSHDETMPLNADLIKILRFATEQPFETIAQLHIPPETWVIFHQFMRSFLQYHVERQLHSENSVYAMLAFAS